MMLGTVDVKLISLDVSKIYCWLVRVSIVVEIMEHSGRIKPGSFMIIQTAVIAGNLLTQNAILTSLC